MTEKRVDKSKEPPPIIPSFDVTVATNSYPVVVNWAWRGPGTGKRFTSDKANTTVDGSEIRRSPVELGS